MPSFFNYPRFTSPVSPPTTDLNTNKISSPTMDESNQLAPAPSSHSDLLFGGFDFDEPQFTEDRPMFAYDPPSDSSAASSPHFIDSSAVSPFMFDDVSFDSGGYVSAGDSFRPSASAGGDVNFMSQYIDERLYSPTMTSPIPVPNSTSFGMQPYVAHSEAIPFPVETTYHSPDFNQWHSPTANSLGLMLEDLDIKPNNNGQTLNDAVVEPAWVNELWDNTGLSSSPPSRPQLRHSSLSDRLQRRRVLSGPLSVPLSQPFLSSSAPTGTITPAMARAHSRRAESVSEEDRDATIRGKKASSPIPDIKASDNGAEAPLLKPVLKPPKLAPSAWQLFFTDWIQRHQATNRKKLNVAQAAKEAGQEYATLSPEEKEPYRRRSQAAKERREREMEAYMRSLTPDEIKRENMFRAEQRKLGKSRRSNVKDPNAPKKPLSAYFMFLQRIRSDPALVKEIFGDETETTKQSVLAAAKWRSLTDEERKPFLAQAERDKIEYEAARRLYEDGTTGYTGSINFSISPPETFASPIRGTIKVESESESEGFVDERQRFR